MLVLHVAEELVGQPRKSSPQKKLFAGWWRVCVCVCGAGAVSILIHILFYFYNVIVWRILNWVAPSCILGKVVNLKSILLLLALFAYSLKLGIYKVQCRNNIFLHILF